MNGISVSTYGLVLIVTVLVAHLAYALRLQAAGKKSVSAVISLVLSSILGFVFAKVGFVLMEFDKEFGTYGFEAFLRMRADAFSVFFGGFGVLLGVALSARLVRLSPAWALDAFAPCGALILCGVRIGEYFLESIGHGALLPDDSPFTFFPLSVMKDYGYDYVEYYWAVFVLEALLAFIVCAVFLLKNPDGTGTTCEIVMYCLAAPQIFSESLRARCMKWGFVRVEQVLCGVLLLLLIERSCRLCRRQTGFFARFWPVLGVILGIGIIVWCEFALDKFAISNTLVRIIMIAVVILMMLLEFLAMARRKADT